MYENNYGSYLHRLSTETVVAEAIQEQRRVQSILNYALHAEQIKEFIATLLK